MREITMARKAKSSWNGFSLKPRKEMPAGLWTRCPACEQMLYKKAVAENLDVCPECDHHFRIDADMRIKYLADEESFAPIHEDLTSNDPLKFEFRGTTYKKRIEEDQAKSGTNEAIRIGKAFIKGRPVFLRLWSRTF